MSLQNTHLHDELSKNTARVVVQTRFGKVTGGRANNGAAVFLEIPYALSPKRFEDPEPLPQDFRYEDKEYISEASYCFQPHNDGQSAHKLFEDKVGFGKPTENPLFCNIVSPPSFPDTNSGPFPVKVYIHGGFLQFGAPHSLGNQAQYVSASRSEVRVNIGYRLSAFGFLACQNERVNLSGNYGFKDQWLALKWVKDNIQDFGGDPNNIQIIGLSAGAHSVHQLLHYASHLPEGEVAPFRSAVLMSNAIVVAAKTPAELEPQYNALCHSLCLNPTDLDAFNSLRNPSKTPAETICKLIETDAVGTQFGTYRSCTDNVNWMPASPDLMEYQRSGDFARGLRSRGVKSVVVGDLSEEWYLYSIAHPIPTSKDIKPNLMRYYDEGLVDKILGFYKQLPEDASTEESTRLFGEILSDWQVHLPVRLLARDLVNAEFPVLRYHFRWTPKSTREGVGGYVTHGTDGSIWHYRLPVLESEDAELAKAWLDQIETEVAALERADKPLRDVRKVLVVNSDRSIRWDDDEFWNEKMRLTEALD